MSVSQFSAIFWLSLLLFSPKLSLARDSSIDHLLRAELMPAQQEISQRFCIVNNNVAIVIVGAGAAGLSAAESLHKAGFINVTILEAQSRTGGRVYSQVQEGTHFVELGAQWVHGRKQWLYDFANANDLLAPITNATDGYLMDVGGNPSPSDLAILTNATDFLVDLEKSFSSKNNRPDNVLQNESVEQDRSELFLKTFLLNQTNQGRCNLNIAAYDFQIRKEMISTAASTPDTLSHRYYTDYIQDGPNFSWKANVSYEAVLNEITSTFPRSWIKLNKSVGRIIQGNANDTESKLVVECKDGGTFTAEHVIVTVSLGVLKTSPELFKPALSERKKDVFAKAGFGTISKLFLKFPTPFWQDLEPKGSKNFGFLWTLNTTALNVPFGGGASTTRHPWYRYATQFGPALTAVNYTLRIMVGAGPDAENVDSVSDSVVLDDCWNLLKQFAGTDQIPKPESLVRELWSTNPNILGTYSFFSLDSSKANYTPADIATPEWSFEKEWSGGKVAHSLLFAGEATDDKFFSTVHGAILSGRREADRITAYYKTSAASQNVASIAFASVVGVLLLTVSLF